MKSGLRSLPLQEAVGPRRPGLVTGQAISTQIHSMRGRAGEGPLPVPFNTQRA